MVEKVSMGNFVFDATVTGTATPGPLEQMKFFFISQYRGASKQKLIKVLQVESCQG